MTKHTEPREGLFTFTPGHEAARAALAAHLEAAGRTVRLFTEVVGHKGFTLLMLAVSERPSHYIKGGER